MASPFITSNEIFFSFYVFVLYVCLLLFLFLFLALFCLFKQNNDGLYMMGTEHGFLEIQDLCVSLEIHCVHLT